MRTPSPPDVSRPTVSRGDRVALWLVAGAAAAVAALLVVGIVVSAVRATGDEPLTVREMPLTNARTPEFTEPFAQIIGAHYESITVTVTGVPEAARWLLWGSSAATALAAVGVSLSLAWLCLRVLRLRPFGRSVTVALATSAFLVVIGWTVSQYLAAAGRAEVVSFLGPASTGGADTERPEGYEGFSSYVLNLDLAPIGVGVALAVVALAFQLGARMQRDTEGLV